MLRPEMETGYLANDRRGFHARLTYQSLSLFFSFLWKNKAEPLEGQRGTLAARAERCDLGMALRSWNAFFS